MYCKNCGTEITNTATFCPKCGQKVAPQTIKDIVPGNPSNLKWFLLGAVVLFCIITVSYTAGSRSRKENESYQNPEIEADSASIREEREEKEETKKLSMQEQIDNFLAATDAGDDDASYEKLQQMMQEYGDESELYLKLTKKLVKRNEIEDARELLLIGFEQTEDESLMEEYLNISIKYAPDGNGEIYMTLLQMAELYAKASDNEDKLELAKQIFYYAIQ